MPPLRFAVLGAGVAGLQASHQLKEAGHSVTIFEKSGNVGGVWQKNYANYSLQVKSWHYTFPGYGPIPGHKSYPKGQDVQAYIESYARDAGLLPLTRFHVAVQALRPQGPAGADGWEIEYVDSASKSQKEVFDYVVVATGLFNTPLHPAWAKGLAQAEAGKGEGPWVVDAKDFSDTAAAKGKRVVIVGAGKTAIDLGVGLSKSEAASVTLVARRGHWMAPRTVLGIIPFEFASYTRWSWALQPAYYDSSAIKKAAHTVFRPVKAAAWGLFGVIFNLQNGTPANLKPSHGLLEGVYDTVGIVDSGELSKAFKSKRLQTRKAEVKALQGHELTLSDGSKVEADIVILATGYRPIARSLFPDEQLQKSAGFGEDDSHYLYRNVLPPSLANIAFVGQNATFQHVATTALQARWLVDVLGGAIKLPPRAEQEADLAKQKAWDVKFNGVKRNNHWVWAQHGKYHDALVRDIRGSPLAAWNLFGYITNEKFAPLFPANVALRAKAGKGGKVATGSTNGVAVTAGTAEH